MISLRIKAYKRKKAKTARTFLINVFFPAIMKNTGRSNSEERVWIKVTEFLSLIHQPPGIRAKKARTAMTEASSQIIEAGFFLGGENK